MRRAAFTERLPRDRGPLPHRDPVGRALHGRVDVFGSTPLHLARGRAVRRPRQAPGVGGLRAVDAVGDRGPADDDAAQQQRAADECAGAPRAGRPDGAARAVRTVQFGVARM